MLLRVWASPFDSLEQRTTDHHPDAALAFLIPALPRCCLVVFPYNRAEGDLMIDREQARKRYQAVKKRLNERVVGQDEPKSTLLSFIKNYITGVHDKNSPIGAFMATGPTGVGKTEVAKVLNDVLFDGRLIRFDMNEFGEEDAKSRLIGVPPGKQGSEAGGQLTRALLGEGLNDEPDECVLLFDEIEKADPDIYDVFLRIFDEGAYQDQNGTLVDCTKTFIILTSNADQGVFLSNVESDRDAHTNVASDLKEEIRNEDQVREDEVEDEFPAEFLNRLDDVLYFDPLSEEDLMDIMDIQFQDFQDEIHDTLDLTVEITETAKTFVIDQVYDIRYGARPLEGGIKRHIRRALSDYLLKHDHDHGDAVLFDCKDEAIVAEPVQATDDSKTDEDWLDDLNDNSIE